MRVTADKLLRPTEEELNLFSRLFEVYSVDNGEKFEELVRLALLEDIQFGRVTARKNGQATAMNIEERDESLHLKGNYYLLKPSELPDLEHHDLFRRLCQKSPSMPVDVELPNGQIANAHLVEESDLQRLLKCLLEMFRMLLGMGKKDPKRKHTNDFDLS